MLPSSFRLTRLAFLCAGLLESSPLGSPAAAADGSGPFAPASQTPGTARLEPLGQSSRRTGLVLSEIHYNPLNRADGRRLEFVELYNAGATVEDLSGWRLDGDADYLFATNTTLAAGAFLVVAAQPADLQAVYGISGVLGPFSSTNGLPNGSGTIRLRHRTGAVFLEARYDSAAPWPVAADGAGHSLVLARPSFGEGNVEAWAASDSVGGSPGGPEPVTGDPLRNVVINEFFANSEPPLEDYIELYNHGASPVDISGCSLSDDRNTNKFIIPNVPLLSARGFVVFTQTQLGFALASSGETIYLRNPTRTRVLDAVRYEAQGSGVASGRTPDGAPFFSALTARTPGLANSPASIPDIGINELMYHPISLNADDEYVELFNRGTGTEDLSGWRLQEAVTFRFPPGTRVPPGGYLVVARNLARLLSLYPNLGPTNALGDFNGSLADSGERVVLARPEESISTTNGLVLTNVNFVVVDEVRYRRGGRWGQLADGGGSSLELTDDHSDRRLAANWADSVETAKAPWTTVSVTGVLDNASAGSAADQLQVLLQGPGECLIDDVEVRNASGVNVVANSTFETGAGGWTAEGTQEASGLESGEGYASSRSYHVRASDRGDNQVNRIRTPLTAVLANGSVATIKARVRWLKGHPQILFRLRSNVLEAAVDMELPIRPGTPGLVNSRAVPNAPPGIYDVTHFPPVPAANQAVTVTARIQDPDGVGSVVLRYRLDPSATLLSVPMVDNGTGADAVAGDGLYTGVLPGQAANVLAAFHVQATDLAAAPVTGSFPRTAPTQECLVRFGETVPAGTFPSYKIWMTQAAFDRWDARNNLNNTLNDITFVLGNHRVIYNAGAVYAGSPYIAPGFTTPAGNRCGYSIEFPGDDTFMGSTALVLDWPGGHGNENTAIQEQMAYYIADQMNLPFSHRYFIRLSVNGATDMQRGGVFEAVLQPGSEYLSQWVPGAAKGNFYKIDRGFEFNDAGGLISDPMPQLQIYTTPDPVSGGVRKKTEKYRWYWSERVFDRANDYTNLFALADAVNAAGPEPYTSQTEALADVEEWMGIFAVEHIINNFDSWGHTIGKNMYMFKPQNGRWQIYLFDLDWLMLVAPGGPGNYTASTGPLFAANDPTVIRMYNHPPFRRAYFRAIQNAVDAAFVPGKFEAVMDAKYAALVANGITLCDGQALAAPTALKTWFSQRRTFLLGQLATVAAPFSITSTNDVTLTNNLVTLTGTAPIKVKSVAVNGVEWAVTWTGVTNWSLRLPVDAGTNELALIGLDPAGLPVAGATNFVTVTVAPALPLAKAVGAVVINEIMYHPVLPGAEFVELFNSSSNTAFNLRGWRINALGYTFSRSALLAPRSYLLLVQDRVAAVQAYGTNLLAWDVFAGSLQPDGETLTLFRPAAAGQPEEVVDQVRYEPVAPWGPRADGHGTSLQLTDAAQDNSRVSNWSDSSSGWRFFSFTGVASTSRLLVYLESLPGEVRIDDLSIVAGSVPGVGENLVRNGGFEGPLTTNSGGPWIFFTSGVTNSSIDTSTRHSGTSCLRFVCTLPGGGSYLYQEINPIVTNTTYTVSYWYLQATNDTRLVTRLNPAFRPSNPVKLLTSTPGTTNSTASVLPPYPPLWLNEVQSVNIDGPVDSGGRREPWAEIYNAGNSPATLEGFTLSTNYADLAGWTFPAGAVLQPGEFRTVFLDGEPGQTTAVEWHASIRLAPGAGSVVLSRPFADALQILDYINYPAVGAGHSYGSFPDGQPFFRQEFLFPTARAANNAASAPVTVFINEWMASNTRTLADTASGGTRYDDWFELYNAGSSAVDLAGHFLTDHLTNRFQFVIPAGYVIPARGYLLVWADSEPGQNSPARPDLHVNFQLSRTGEEIGLFAPDGTLVDGVTFGAQTNDVSQGRYPDGAAAVYFMPTPTPRLANLIPGVAPRPGFNQITRSGNQLTFGWSTVAGRTYRVEYADDLKAGPWIPLGPDTVAGGESLSLSLQTTTPAQRFFRVVLLP